MIHKEMTNEEVDALVKKYFDAEGYTFPGHYEHRVDPKSSAVIYAMVREYQPTAVGHAGTWRGGSTGVIMAALLKNGKKFSYVASELMDDLRAETEANVAQHTGQAPVMIGDITKDFDKLPKVMDCFYHDTNHDRETTESVVKNVFPRIKKGGLVMFHDWAVTEQGDKWVGKDGMWPETEYLLELHAKGELPLEKVYWNYNNPGGEELGVFLKL